MTIDPYIILGAAIIGFLVGMTGAGGGALMTPMLILLFGIKPSTAISSVACDRQRPGRVRGIAAVVHRPRSLRATRHHVRDRRVRPEVRGRRRDGAGVDPVRDPPRRLRVVAGGEEALAQRAPSSRSRPERLRAPVVTGLAHGTPAQTLIARSILVTTAGGRGQVRIHFSKANVAKLRKLRHATLMLRLVVRNGSNASATALTKSTLGA